MRGALIFRTRRPRTILVCQLRDMYYSEYLRNKKQAAPRIISPPTGVPSSLHTQIQRFKSALPVVTPISGGQMLELSGDGVIASKGRASVCCSTTITTATTIPGQCCDLIAPTQYPRGFYGPVTPDCCSPVNGPPIKGTVPCCPNLPANTSEIIFKKPPKTQG